MSDSEMDGPDRVILVLLISISIAFTVSFSVYHFCNNFGTGDKQEIKLLKERVKTLEKLLEVKEKSNE